MNARLAKKLRKIALGMVAAAEEKTGKQIEKVSYLINDAGTVTVAKNSWKGAYKALKNGVRKNSAGSAFADSLKTATARREAVSAL